MVWMQLVATDERPQLRFEDETQQARFELGVASAIFLWDDLAYAVDALLGGPESHEKREWLTAAIVDLFDAKEVTTDDIEDRLVMAMEDEFDTVLETDSAERVAEQIARLYEQCAQGSYDEVFAMYDRWQQVEARPKAKPTPATANSDSDSDSDSEGEQQEEVPELMQVDESKKEPIVDEDGFTVVQKGRRK